MRLMRLLYLLLAIQILLLAFLFLPAARAQGRPPVECPGAVAPRLEYFGDAVIAGNAPQPVRAEPDLSSPALIEVPAGAVVNVINDSACVNAIRWWEVAYLGELGWLPEAYAATYVLAPYTPPEPQSVATVDDDGGVTRVESPHLSFTFDPALAAGVTMQPQTGYMLRDAMSPSPAYTFYEFVDYQIPVPPYGNGPDIALYPLGAWARILGRPVATDLQALLDERPDLPPVNDTGQPRALPYLPYQNAAQFFAAQPQYLDFENGAGIRYVTYYAQSTVEITGWIFYTFQGVSADGETYISADFPVQLPAAAFPVYDDAAHIASQDDDGPLSDYYRQYVAELAANINALDPGDFTPPLDTLDALIASMTVATPD